MPSHDDHQPPAILAFTDGSTRHRVTVAEWHERPSALRDQAAHSYNPGAATLGVEPWLTVDEVQGNVDGTYHLWFRHGARLTVPADQPLYVSAETFRRLRAAKDEPGSAVHAPPPRLRHVDTPAAPAGRERYAVAIQHLEHALRALEETEDALGHVRDSLSPTLSTSAARSLRLATTLRAQISETIGLAGGLRTSTRQYRPS